MTRQLPDTLFPVEPLPADVLNKDGKRTKESRWTMLHVRGIEVTQGDIDNAMRENSHSCMIAEAIKRQVKGAKSVAVDIATIRWTDTIKNRRIVCLTPPIAQDGLSRFDLGVKPRPFSFALRSTQITTVAKRPAVGADGKTIAAKPRVVVGTDGVVRERGNGVRTENVKPPSPRVDSRRGGVQPLVLGGVTPPHNRASRFRKFGMKGFTWTDDENPEDVIARQRALMGKHQK